MVAPGAVSYWAATEMPTPAASTPSAIARPIVDRKPAADQLRGRHRHHHQALTSSSPTARMATVTVTAVSHGQQQVERAHRQAGDPGVLLVLADREQPRAAAAA